MKAFLEKFFLSILFLAVGLIPTWIFLTVRAFAEPVGFWGNLALSALGIWCLGAFQLFLLVFLVMALVSLWQD